MFAPLRSGAEAAGRLAGDAALFAKLLGASGLTRTVRPLALPSFLPVAIATRGGPHLAPMWHARSQPRTLAAASDRRSLSYAELDAEANQLARALVTRGVAPGDRVALLLPNSVEHVVAQQALARLGASAVQIGYRLKPAEIAYIFEHAEPAALITYAGGAAAAREAMEMARPGLAERTLITELAAEATRPMGDRYEDALASERPDRPPSGADARRGSLIVYTSGTTGRPKGATRSLRQTGLVAFAEMALRVGMRHDDRHLVVCPLYHSGAVAFANLMLALGASLYVRDHFDPEAFLADVANHQITSAFVVPTMLVRILELPEATRRRYDTSSLRWIMSGAAPLAPETANRFQAAFGPILWNFYGATETGLVTLAGPEDHAARPGTVGRALRGNEIRILGEDGAPVAPGEVGELYVHNAMLIAGYHRDEGATASSMRDGFFSVGDLARIDEDGYLYLASRVHDMVISGGVNIYPREIEDRLYEHPDVADAAVVGLPDPEWGEVVAAFVVPRAGSTLEAEALIGFCRETLAGFKCPRRVEVVEELPRSPTGKVLKRVLVAGR
jgi:fatty-acyl-CoA synthase